jgi:hypothetical protein
MTSPDTPEALNVNKPTIIARASRRTVQCSIRPAGRPRPFSEIVTINPAYVARLLTLTQADKLRSRRWFFPVHSRSSICATSTELTPHALRHLGFGPSAGA